MFKAIGSIHLIVWVWAEKGYVSMSVKTKNEWLWEGEGHLNRYNRLTASQSTYIYMVKRVESLTWSINLQEVSDVLHAGQHQPLKGLHDSSVMGL